MTKNITEKLRKAHPNFVISVQNDFMSSIGDNGSFRALTTIEIFEPAEKDIVEITKSLGRSVRRVQAVAMHENAEESETRSIERALTLLGL